MPPHSVLLMFHCSTNTGYAIGRLESVFHEAARALAQDDHRIHYVYSDNGGGAPAHLSGSTGEIAFCRYFTNDLTSLSQVGDLVRRRRVKAVLAFDLPLRAPILDAIRSGGRNAVVSYWGAPISSVYPWYLRPARKLQYLSALNRPDHFVFESEGMRRGALLGAAIPKSRTSVVELGVDCQAFRPAINTDESRYAHTQFEIPPDRKVVFFSGHMEPRKGVDVLLRACALLKESFGRSDFHLLLLGNTAEDEHRLRTAITSEQVAQHVTFGGYRNDVARIQRSAYVGVVASTGWDSFTMSSVELAATGVPLVVSDLPGLAEAVVPGDTGLRVTPGDAVQLANVLAELLDSPSVRDKLGAGARRRAEAEFGRQRQIDQLAATLNAEIARVAAR